MTASDGDESDLDDGARALHAAHDDASLDDDDDDDDDDVATGTLDCGEELEDDDEDHCGKNDEHDAEDEDEDSVQGFVGIGIASSER